MKELYKRFRPKSLDKLIGQDAAVAMIRGYLDTGNFPQAVALTGPSGCGKTTTARIMQAELKCEDGDFCEINAADVRGIEQIRDVRSRMHFATLGGGKSRIWLFDEAHQLTKDAQTALLKMCEDTPANVYFMLASTDPEKFIPTLRNRCTEIKFQLLTVEGSKELMSKVLKKLDQKINDEVAEAITEVADGSARKILVLLDQVLAVKGKDAQLQIIESSDSKAQAIELAKALLNERPWKEVADLIKAIQEEPEKLRWMVLGYATSVVLGGGKFADRAMWLIQEFRENWYDCKKAGLVAACREVSLKK